MRDFLSSQNGLSGGGALARDSVEVFKHMVSHLEILVIWPTEPKKKNEKLQKQILCKS